MKSDHRSKFSNLSNWKKEAWKISGLQWDSNPWPPVVRCSTNWAMNFIYIFHIISLHRKIWTQQIDLAPNVWLHSSVDRASHRYRGGHGFESRWKLDIFKASSFQLLKLENLLPWSLLTSIYSRSTNIWILYIYISIYKYMERESNTWARCDMALSLQVFNSNSHEWAQSPNNYRVEHEQRFHISKKARCIIMSLCKRLTSKKKPTQFTFQKREGFAVHSLD